MNDVAYRYFVEQTARRALAEPEISLKQIMAELVIESRVLYGRDERLDVLESRFWGEEAES